MTTRPTPPPTPRLRSPRLLVVAVLLMLAPLSAGLYCALHAGDVPDPLPTHWGPGGEVDGTTSLTTFTLLALGATLVVAALGVALLPLLRPRPLAVAGVVFTAWVAWLAATTYAATLTAASGAATAAEVPLEPGLVVAILLVPSLVAVMIWLLVPLVPREARKVSTPSSPLSVDADERVTWIGQASSQLLLLGALLLVLTAVSTVFVLWPLALALGLAAIAVAWVHRITLRVDNTAVTVAWSPFRWPRISVPLSDVTAAHTATIEPLAWGGWGYRVTPRGHAAVSRRGPGVVLSRRERAPLAVTVDAPDGAVDLVNALVASRTRPPRSGPDDEEPCASEPTP